MSKVIIFSRTFPAYHPKAGQPTYFVEKLLNGLSELQFNFDTGLIPAWSSDFCESIIAGIECTKFHTIRAGNRWKAGDKFSPRVWSGKPYRSEQIILTPDIEVLKVWDITISKSPNWFGIYFLTINNKTRVSYDANSKNWDNFFVQRLAENDGLSVIDFSEWFKMPNNFTGQIICWNSKIEY